MKTAPLFAGLMILMGIAPLSAWGRSTVKSLGRALWKPAYILGCHFGGGLRPWCTPLGGPVGLLAGGVHRFHHAVRIRAGSLGTPSPVE